MRLKILFFPIVLVVVIYVSIVYIWPEYQAGVDAKKALEQRQGILDETRNKKANIESLKSSLDRNLDKEKIIMDYLPESNQEEKIINSIDHIATSAGVSLADFSVASIKPTVVASPPIENNHLLFGKAGQSDETATVGNIPAEIKPELAFMESKIIVVGEYEYIKNFLNQLNGIGIYSTIDSIVISKQKSENSEIPTTALSAEVSAKFAYLPKIENKRNLTGGIDFSVSDAISKLVLGTPAVPSADLSGKTNPFLP